jgi:RNA polymerase sigma-70 factor (ECF subfamily)
VEEESQLVSRARNDTSAFVQLYRRNYDAIFRYCMHRLYDRETAKDITSEIFLKAVENFHRFKGSDKHFRNWLYKIATNAVNKHFRKTAHRDKLLKIVSEQVDNKTDNCEETVEKMALLKEAMLTLKPRHQTIITLRFFENLKLIEIAEVLDSKPGTIRSQLSRALTRLRKILAVKIVDK